MTDGELKALRIIKAYVTDKGYSLVMDEDNGCLINVWRDGRLFAEIIYDSLMGVLTVDKTGSKPRSIFLYHPTILMLLDIMFDPPPPVCDPDR